VVVLQKQTMLLSSMSKLEIHLKWQKSGQVYMLNVYVDCAWCDQLCMCFTNCLLTISYWRDLTGGHWWKVVRATRGKSNI